MAPGEAICQGQSAVPLSAIVECGGGLTRAGVIPSGPDETADSPAIPNRRTPSPSVCHVTKPPAAASSTSAAVQGMKESAD